MAHAKPAKMDKFQMPLLIHVLQQLYQPQLMLHQYFHHNQLVVWTKFKVVMDHAQIQLQLLLSWHQPAHKAKSRLVTFVLIAHQTLNQIL